MTNDRKPWEPKKPTISDLVSLQAFREKTRQNEKAAKAKYGKRTQIPLLPRAKWVRAYDSVHVRRLILLCQKDFSKLELAVLGVLDLYHGNKDPLGITHVQHALKLGSKRHASEAIARLAQACLIVNVGTLRIPHLAIQPTVEYWRFRELHELRVISKPTRKPWNGTPK